MLHTAAARLCSQQPNSPSTQPHQLRWTPLLLLPEPPSLRNDLLLFGGLGYDQQAAAAAAAGDACGTAGTV